MFLLFFLVYPSSQAAYPPQIVNFLRSLFIDPTKAISYLRAARRGGFIATVNGTSTITPLTPVNMSARADTSTLSTVVSSASTGSRSLMSEVPHLANLTVAACLWLKEQQATVLQWGAKVSISFISPKQGTTSGYDVIRIVGSGFGLTAPLTAYASIGGQSCIDTRWIDSTVLECITPQGIGQSLDIAVQVGSQIAVLKGAFSYFPATVRAITSVDSARQQNAGTALYISGANFYNSATLRCKFSGGTNGERSVAATFINFTALACTPPPTFSGALQVAVTNDGERYSLGLKLDSASLRFADGLSQAPPDFGPELAPSVLTIAFLIDSDLQKRDKTAIFERIVSRTVNEIITANKILPFTNISVVSYYVKSPPASAPDQGDEGTVLQNEQYRQQMADLYLRIRKAHKDLVGLVGPEQSVAAVPILQAMANYSVTLGLPSPSMISFAANDPALSSPVTYPTFLRVVPSSLTYARALAELLAKMQPTFIRNSALQANASATIVHAVVTVDDAPSVAAYDAFRTYLESFGGGISRIAKIKTRDSAQLVAQAMQASGISSASGAALSRLVFVAANREASVRVLQAGGLVTTPGSMLGASGGNSRVWVGLQNLADAIIYDTADAAVASIIALQASPGKSATAVKLREESLGSVLGPFIHDAVGAYLNSIDSYIRKVKSPDLTAYNSIELLDLVRGAAHPEAVTGYVGFAPASNDPQMAEFEILNTFGMTSAQVPAYPTVEQVSQVLGTIIPGSANSVSFNSSVKAVLWNGPDPDYVLPEKVTVLVPFPVHPNLVKYTQFGAYTVSGYQTPFDIQRDFVNYTLAWEQDLATGVVKGLPPVYLGLPYSYTNNTVDTALISSLFGGQITSATGGILPYATIDLDPSIVVPSVANPFTVVDPDDPTRPVGDQIQIFHPSSLFWQTLEGLTDDLNALAPAASPLKGAKVELVGIPYFLETRQGLENAHVNLAATLHDALYKLHTNGTAATYPNVIGILGMNTNAGTKALADAVAAFPGPQPTIVNVDNTVLSRLNRLPIVSYGATTSEFSSPTNSANAATASSAATGRYRNLVRVVPPAYVDAAAIVDMCRRARWTSVGVIYSGIPGAGDPLFDFGEEYVGLETYSAFVNEASRQGIRILAALNVSNYLSASTVPQSPYRDPTITSVSQVGPSNYASDREAALFGEMLAMKRAGARVIIMLAGRRALCPVMRAAWAAGMVVSAPPDMPFDKIAVNGDFPTAFSRVSALRDGRDIYPASSSLDVTTTVTGSSSGTAGAWVDPFNTNVSATLRAQAILNNASWAQGSDGLFYPPFATTEVYSWVLSSGNMLTHMPSACIAQVPPDYWAYMAAELRGDIGYGRPLGREPDGNIRRSVFSGYDYLSGKSVGGSGLFASIGPAASWGSPTQQLSLLARSVKRAAKDALYDPVFGIPTSQATVKTLITDTLFQTGFFAESFATLRGVLRTPALRNALSQSDRAGAQAYFASPSSVKPWPASLLQRVANAAIPENTPHDFEVLMLDARKNMADALLPTTGTVNPLVDYPQRNDLAAIPATPAALRVLNSAFTVYSMIGGPLNNIVATSPFTSNKPVTTTKSIYNFPSSTAGTASGESAIVGSVSQIAMPHQSGMAHRGLRALLLSAAGAISDLQSVANPDIIMAYLRGRVPAKGLITAPPLAGDLGGTVPITPGSNDPYAASYDLVNRQGPNANALVRVGSVADRGYVRFMGCPPGSEPDGDFKCRACPVNSWKSESGSQPCASCPYAGKTRSRMITRGKTGSKSPSECLCPVGFYVLPQPTEAEDPGTICVPCVRSMQCDKVHLLLTNVRNSPGFWRGDSASPFFFACLKPAHCNSSSLTALQPLTAHYEATAMNGTSCSGNTEGPLCNTCIAGYGKTSEGLCEQCPPMGSVYMSLALPCMFAILLVSVLAAMQVGTTPSYVTWRRINNTKLLISFLQVNAVILSLDLDWPQTVKRYFNISQLSSAVNLSWVAWECVLSISTWPLQMQVFAFYMASPIGLLIFCTGLILLSGLCGKKTFSNDVHSAQRTLEKTAVTGAVIGASGAAPGRRSLKEFKGIDDNNKSMALIPAARPGDAQRRATMAGGLRGRSRWDVEMERVKKQEQKKADKLKQLNGGPGFCGRLCCCCGRRPAAAATLDSADFAVRSKTRPNRHGLREGGKTISAPSRGTGSTYNATTTTSGRLPSSSSRGPAPLMAVLDDAADLDRGPAVSTTGKTIAGNAAGDAKGGKKMSFANANVPRFLLPAARPPPIGSVLTAGDAANGANRPRSGSLSSAGTASTRDALLNTTNNGGANSANDSRRDSAISANSSGKDTVNTSSGGEASGLLAGGRKDNSKDNSKDRARSAPPLAKKPTFGGEGFPANAGAKGPGGALDGAPAASSPSSSWGEGSTIQSEGSVVSDHPSEPEDEEEDEESDFDLEAEEAEVTNLNEFYSANQRNADGSKYVSPIDQDFAAVMASRERSCGARYVYCIDIMWAVLTISLFLLYPTLLEVVFSSIDCTYVGPTSFAPANNSMTLSYIPIVPLNATAASLLAKVSPSPSPAAVASSSLSNSSSFTTTTTTSSTVSVASAAVPLIYSSFIPLARDYLRQDLSVRCDGQLYSSFFWPIAAAFCGLYALGIPTLFIVLVYCNGARSLHLGKGRIRIGGEDYLRLAHRLREVASWVKPGRTRTRLYAHFGGPHEPVSVRLRAVFDALHSPYSAAQQMQLWRNALNGTGGSRGGSKLGQRYAQAAPPKRTTFQEPTKPSSGSKEELGGTVFSASISFSPRASVSASGSETPRFGSPAGVGIASAGSMTNMGAAAAGSTPRKASFAPSATGGAMTTPTNAGKPPLPKKATGLALSLSAANANAGKSSAAINKSADDKEVSSTDEGEDEDDEEGTTDEEEGSSSGEGTESSTGEEGSTDDDDEDDDDDDDGDEDEDDDEESGSEGSDKGASKSKAKKAVSATANPLASVPTSSSPLVPPTPAAKKTSTSSSPSSTASAPKHVTAMAPYFPRPQTATAASAATSTAATGLPPRMPPPGIMAGSGMRAVAFARSAVGGGNAMHNSSTNNLRGAMGVVIPPMMLKKHSSVNLLLPPKNVSLNTSGPNSNANTAPAASMNAYVSAMGNTSGIGPTGAVFVNIHVRDVSFGLRPVSREDFTSASLVIQRNVTLSALLENAFDEAQMIADENALLLTISTSAIAGADGGGLPPAASKGCCGVCKGKGDGAAYSTMDVASSTLFGSGTLVGESMAQWLVRAWTNDQRESATAIYKRFGKFDVLDEEAAEEDDEEDEVEEDETGGNSQNSSIRGGRRGSLSVPRARRGSRASSGGGSLSRAKGGRDDDDDDEIRSRISDKMNQATLGRSPSFGGGSNSIQLPRVPPKGILAGNGEGRHRTSTASSGGGKLKLNPAAPVTNSINPLPSPSSFVAVKMNGGGADLVADEAAGFRASSSAPSKQTQLKKDKSGDAAGRSRPLGAAAYEDEPGFEWPSYPGALYPPGFPVAELQAREKRRGKANTDALLALTLLLTADKVEKVGAIQRRFGWLYVDYRPGAFGYEFWSTLRKGLLVTVAVALSERPALLQCIVCVMILTLYLLIHQHVRPILDISLLPPSNPDDLIAQHRASIDSQAALSSILEGGGAGKGFRNSGGERFNQGWSSASGGGGLFGCGGRDKAAASSGGNGELSDLEINSAPISVGYLGQLQRRLMRNRAALALLQLDPADPLRLGSAIPEAALTPDPPMAELLNGGHATKITFDKEGGAGVTKTALIPIGNGGGAGAAGGSVASGSNGGLGVASAAAGAGGAGAAGGAIVVVPSSSSLTYEDILLLNPSLLKPYHIACCSARARRLSRNTLPICGGGGGGEPGPNQDPNAPPPAPSNFCICACPWWSMQAARLPEVASTSRLDRLGVAAQLLGLVMLFIYEAQQASKAAGTSQQAGNATLVTWVMIVNVGVIFLVCCVIAVDLWQELKLLVMRLLSSDAFTSPGNKNNKAEKKKKSGDKKDDDKKNGDGNGESGGASSSDANKKGGSTSDGSSKAAEEANKKGKKKMLPGVAAVLLTEQAALAAFRRREEALIEQLLAAERALGASE